MNMSLYPPCRVCNFSADFEFALSFELVPRVCGFIVSACVEGGQFAGSRP